MVQWEISDNEVDYNTALEKMDNYVQKIISGEADEKIWLLEHPSLYTAGTSANKKDLVEPNRFPVFETKRGGQYTYHGPGQRVVYVMLDLNKRGKDVKKFVENLEAWIIHTLAEFNVAGQSRIGRVGIWVERPDKPKDVNGLIKEEKIAAIGVRLKKWITFHGLSINVDPDLSHFQGIVPCGIKEHGVTSLVDLGLPISMTDLDIALSKAFSKVF
jgi:lipoyl(octanoyl) transferase|tara:strand:+ start:515 stop:1159 length:645 start_codon:yes stop_codon:yes gene_type:complete